MRTWLNCELFARAMRMQARLAHALRRKPDDHDSRCKVAAPADVVLDCTDRRWNARGL